MGAQKCVHSILKLKSVNLWPFFEHSIFLRGWDRFSSDCRSGVYIYIYLKLTSLKKFSKPNHRASRSFDFLVWLYEYKMLLLRRAHYILASLILPISSFLMDIKFNPYLLGLKLTLVPKGTPTYDAGKTVSSLNYSIKTPAILSF